MARLPPLNAMLSPYLFFAVAFCFALPCSMLRAAGPSADEHVKYRLRIAGSRVIGATLMKSLLEEFLRGEGWTDIEHTATGTDAYTVSGRPAPGAALMGIHVSLCAPEEALRLVNDDLADIAMASRRALPAEALELTKLPELLTPRCEHLLGLDALAVIVHSSNPATTLTREQLRDIFLRRTTLWGGESAFLGAIHPYATEEKVGAAQIFRAAIHPDDALPERIERRSDSAAIGRAVADDPRAIGFAALPAVGDNRVVAIKVDGAALLPEPELVRRGKYPLSRPLYLYSAPRSYSLAGDFLRFATGEKGRVVVGKHGFVAGPDATRLAAPAEPPPAAVPAVAMLPSAPDTRSIGTSASGRPSRAGESKPAPRPAVQPMRSGAPSGNS